jgi:hypothetical protein
MHFLTLLYITIIIVFCIDLSGGIYSLSEFVWKRLFPKIPYNGWRIPLIGCSLCSTWWGGILYLLITGTFSWLMLCYVAFLAFMTPVIATILIIAKDGFIWLLNKIQKLLIN